MKYFNPSYWFKLWILSAPLFNSENQGIYAKSIDNNQKIKDWISKNITSLDVIDYNINSENLTNQPYLLLNQSNQNYLDLQNYENNLTLIENEHQNEKISKRVKKQLPPNPNNIELYVKPILQLEDYWCGPAIAEAILRFYNVNSIWSSLINNQESVSMQSSLADRMNTNFFGGTNPQNWLNVINQIIQERQLNENQYSLTPIDLGVGWSNLFLNFPILIRESLRNNLPVAIAFRGRLPQYNQNRSHFILITGIIISPNDNNIPPNINTSLNTIYNYMDPSDGQNFSITGWDLFRLFYNSNHFINDNGFIISYNSLINQNQNEEENMNFESFGNIINQIQNQNTFSNSLNVILATLFVSNLNCNNRNKRYINPDWNKQFCDLKPQIDKIQGKITTIKILDENTKSDNLKEGTIYVGTENGIYLIYPEGEVHRFDNLNFPIKDIILDGNGSAYVTNNNCEIYHLNLKGWGSEKQNMESCDLKKELKLYYNNDKTPKTFSQTWGNNYYYNNLIKTFNLNKINPLNYQKIEFLGKDEDFKITGVSWGNTRYKPNHFLNEFNNKILKDKIITNIHINNDEKTSEIPEYFRITLQPYDERKGFLAWVEIYQGVGLTWYWENNNYYLQVLDSCYGRTGGDIGGACFLGAGSGIRLYNDENFIQPKIPNSKEFYYNHKKNNVEVNFKPVVNKYWKTHSKTLNLGKINPLNYKKIEFLGDIDSNCWGTMVNWGDWVYTNDCKASWGNVHKWILEEFYPNYNEKGISKSIKTFLKEQNNNFHNIIENTKNQVSPEKEQNLQKFNDYYGDSGKIKINQRFGLTFYWETETNNYFLRVYTLQYCEWWSSNAYFSCNIKIGNGIRLYNDDYDTFETQIPNPNDRKKREITDNNELKNITKWTNEFTKSINHEQHLPIDNKTNFSTNNITSL